MRLEAKIAIVEPVPWSVPRPPAPPVAPLGLARLASESAPPAWQALLVVGGAAAWLAAGVAALCVL